MVVGASQLGQAEGVEGVGLSTSGPEAWAGGFQAVGMDRKHRETLFQQTPHQNAVRALDREALHAQLDEELAQLAEVSLVMGEPLLHERAAVCFEHAHPMRLLGPVYSRTPIHRHPPSRLAARLAASPTRSYHCGCS